MSTIQILPFVSKPQIFYKIAKNWLVSLDKIYAVNGGGTYGRVWWRNFGFASATANARR